MWGGDPAHLSDSRLATEYEDFNKAWPSKDPEFCRRSELLDTYE